MRTARKTAQRMTRDEAKAVKAEHERIFPGMAARCRMSLVQQIDNLDSYRECLARNEEIRRL